MAKVALFRRYAENRTARATVAELQRAGADGREAGVGVFAGQGGNAAPELAQLARAANHLPQADGAGAVDLQSPGIHHLTAGTQVAGRPAVPDGQCSDIDVRRTGIRVRPVKKIVPMPFWIRVPVPLITLAMVRPSDSKWLRLNTSVPLFVIGPVPSVPTMPPLPIWRMPGRDSCPATIGVQTQQHGGARTGLSYCTYTADPIRYRQRVAAIEYQRAVVRHVSGTQ